MTTQPPTTCPACQMESGYHSEWCPFLKRENDDFFNPQAPATEKASETPEVWNPIEHGLQNLPLMVPAHEYNKLRGELTAAQRQNEEMRDHLSSETVRADAYMEEVDRLRVDLEKFREQAAEVERLRSFLERCHPFLVHAACSIPDDQQEYQQAHTLMDEIKPYVFLEVNRAFKALSAAPAGERVASRKVLEIAREAIGTAMACCAQSNDEEREVKAACREIDAELARTAPRSGEVEG